MVDPTGAIYVKKEIKMSWPIRMSAIYEEN